MNSMKQQCLLINVWFTWVGLPALAILMGVIAGWMAFIVVLLAGVFAQIVYVRIFPKMSRWIGYGSVDDFPGRPEKKAGTIAKVTLYTAGVCPFCPIVRARLKELQRTMEFELTELDITFHPGLIREKGFRSVPVIEVNGRYWTGNATTAQLISFLSDTNPNNE